MVAFYSLPPDRPSAWLAVTIHPTTTTHTSPHTSPPPAAFHCGIGCQSHTSPPPAAFHCSIGCQSRMAGRLTSFARQHFSHCAPGRVCFVGGAVGAAGQASGRRGGRRGCCACCAVAPQASGRRARRMRSGRGTMSAHGRRPRAGNGGCKPPRDSRNSQRRGDAVQRAVPRAAARRGPAAGAVRAVDSAAPRRRRRGPRGRNARGHLCGAHVAARCELPTAGRRAAGAVAVPGMRVCARQVRRAAVGAGVDARSKRGPPPLPAALIPVG
eukprot:364370-Chlamydomonas_euryale.AAC.7